MPAGEASPDILAQQWKARVKQEKKQNIANIKSALISNLPRYELFSTRSYFFELVPDKVKMFANFFSGDPGGILIGPVNWGVGIRVKVRINHCLVFCNCLFHEGCFDRNSSSQGGQNEQPRAACRSHPATSKTIGQAWAAEDLIPSKLEQGGQKRQKQPAIFFGVFWLMIVKVVRIFSAVFLVVICISRLLEQDHFFSIATSWHKNIIFWRIFITEHFQNSLFPRGFALVCGFGFGFGFVCGFVYYRWIAKMLWEWK